MMGHNPGAQSISDGLSISLVGNDHEAFQRSMRLIVEGLKASQLILAMERADVPAAASSFPAMEVRIGTAFIAMPMNPSDQSLDDVLDTLKNAAKECGITATRVDDGETNERITDRMLSAIQGAQYVIADLTYERPNVFYEAGYALGLGKIPIYVAKEGTKLHFDVKDYPVIYFTTMRQLRERVVQRLNNITKPKKTS